MKLWYFKNEKGMWNVKAMNERAVFNVNQNIGGMQEKKNPIGNKKIE